MHPVSNVLPDELNGLKTMRLSSENNRSLLFNHCLSSRHSMRIPMAKVGEIHKTFRAG